MLKIIYDCFRLEVDTLCVGQKVEGQSYELRDLKDGTAELVQHHVTLLTCAMTYNFGQIVNELFNEEPKQFATFCFLVERDLPSSLNALEADGTVPGLSTYEAKLLVCGLSRAFFGKANSVGHTNDAASGHKDSNAARSNSKPEVVGSNESKQFSDKYSGIESNIGLPFHN